jgi:hypothetical protein
MDGWYDLREQAARHWQDWQDALARWDMTAMDYHSEKGLDCRLESYRAMTCPVEIIKWLDINGGFNIGGKAGTNPQVVYDYLVEHGHNADISYLPTDLDDKIKNSDVRIFLYIGDLASGYVHYVTIKHDPMPPTPDDEFLIYNYSYSPTKPVASRQSIDDFVAVGWRGQAYQPLALITLSK